MKRLLENTDSEKTAQYSQIWRFPTYSKELGHYGFTNDEIVLDAKNNSVKTQDEGSVNLFMSHFSNENLSYKKYYGSKGEEDGDGIYRGWTANGIQGLRIPSTDVYVKWGDAENNLTTSVMSFLMPSKTEAVPYDSLISLNDSLTSTTGFKAVVNGVTVTSIFNENAGILEAEGVKAKAKNLVLTKKNGVIKGLVLDCSEIYYNGSPVKMSGADFEFIAEDGALSIINAVMTPSAFEWQEAGEKDYAAYSDDEKETLGKINSATLPKIKSWLDENKTLFNLYRGRKIEFSTQSDFISNEIYQSLPITRITELSEIIYKADKKWLETVLPINVKDISVSGDTSIKLTFDIYKPWEIKSPVLYIAGYADGGMLAKVVLYELMEGATDKCVDNISVKEATELVNLNLKEIKAFIWNEDGKMIPLSESVLMGK